MIKKEKELNRLYHREQQFVELEHPEFIGYEFILVPSHKDCLPDVAEAIKVASPCLKFSDKPFNFTNCKIWKFRGKPHNKDYLKLFDESKNFLPKKLEPIYIREYTYERLKDDVKTHFVFSHYDENAESPYYWKRSNRKESLYKLNIPRTEWKVVCNKVFVTKRLIPDSEAESLQHRLNKELYYSGDQTLTHHWGQAYHDRYWTAPRFRIMEEIESCLMREELEDYERKKDEKEAI